MSHFVIDHSDTPIRLFKSDFLEFFTHISPVAIVLIWTPVIALFLWRAVVERPLASSGIYILICFIAGLLFWTLAEYTLHRFLFHLPPRTKLAERISYLFHGIHHVQPQCKTRLVMPPAVSIPMAVIIYGLMYLVLGVLLRVPLWVNPLVGGMLTGYVIYDLTHYATHHFPMRSGYLKYLKRYHMQHHYKTPDDRFGVTSPIWDWVFHTLPD